MARKKKSKKEEIELPVIELEPIVVEAVEAPEPTVEELRLQGYAFLKEKGDRLVFTKNSRRVSIKK